MADAHPVIQGQVHPVVKGPSGPPGSTDHGEQTGKEDDDHPQYLLLDGRSGQEVDDDIVIKGSTSDNTSTTLSAQNSDGDHTFSVKGDGAVQVGAEDPYAWPRSLNSHSQDARFVSHYATLPYHGTAMVFDRGLGTIDEPVVLPKDYMVAIWTFRASLGVPGIYGQIANIKGYVAEDYQEGETPTGKIAIGTVSPGASGMSTKLTINSDGTIKLLYYSFPNSAGLPGQVMTPDGAGALVWAEAASTTATTEDLIAGEDISGQRIVYKLDGKAYYADKDTSLGLQAILGMSKGAASSGAAITVVTSGLITDPSFSLDSPASVFLGNNGSVTQVAPTTGTLVNVGYATSATSMNIRIQQPITLI